MFRLFYELGERIGFLLIIFLVEVIFLIVIEEKLLKIFYKLFIGVIYVSRCYDKVKIKEYEKIEDILGIV